MITFFRRYVLVVPILLAGCNSHDIAWMPDSSGFVFRKSDVGTSEIQHFDLGRNATRTLVVGDPTYTRLPGISPDGKRFALAKVIHSPKGGTVQVFIYDISGELVSTSAEYSTAASEEWQRDLKASAVHWSNDGIHLVITDDIEILGWFNCQTNIFRRCAGLRLYFGSQLVVTPDGKGVIGGRPPATGAKPFEGLTFIDWEGWEHAFTRPTSEPDWDEKDSKSMTWSANQRKIDVALGKVKVHIDMPTRAISFSKQPDLPPARGIDGTERQVFFAAGKTCVSAWSIGKNNETLAVRLIDQNKSREVLNDVQIGWFKVAPNDQMTAVMYTKEANASMERRIVVIRANGEIAADMLCESTPLPAAKPLQSGSVGTLPDTPTISHWKSYRRIMNKYLPIVESPDRTKAREACSSLVQELTAIPTKDVDPLLVKLTVDGASLFRDRLAGDKYLTSPAFLINGALQGAAGDPLASSREANALSEQIRTRMADYTRRFPEAVAALSKKHGIDFMEIK